MRLFLYELKKIFGKKEFIIYITLLLCVNIFLLWFYTQPNSKTPPPSAYRKLTAELANVPAADRAEYIQNEFDRISGILKIDGLVKSYGRNSKGFRDAVNGEYKDVFLKYRDIYASGNYVKYADSMYTEYYFLKDCAAEAEMGAGYEDFLTDIQNKADRLSQISIFNKDGGYDILNIQDTAKAYRDMSGIDIDYSPQKGLVTAINFKYSDVVLIFAMILLASFIVRDEKDNGMLYLIRTTAKGKINTAAAKAAAMAVALFITVTLLYIVNLLYCNFTFGLGNLTRTIQSVPYLMRSTMKINVAQYLLIFIFTKWVAAFICGSWILFAMFITKNVFTGYALSLAMPFANLLIRNAISATSKYNAVKYANLISFLQTNEILGGYRNIYWFNKPVRLFLVEIIASVIFMVFFLVLFLLSFELSRQSKSGTRKLKLPFKPKAKPTTVFKQENYKMLVMNGGAFVLRLFFGFQIYTAYTAENYITAEEMFYAKYMKEITGPYDEQARDYLTEQSKKFSDIYKANKLLQTGFINSQEYDMIAYADYGLKIEYDVFRKVLSKVSDLKRTPGAQLVYETGYNKFFDFEDILDLKDYMITVLVITLLFAGMFNIEKSTGMNKVIKATPLGMEYTAKSKMKTAFYWDIVVTVAGILPRFWQIGTGYGFVGLFVPALSLEKLKNLPVFVPIVAVMVLMILARFAVTFTLSAAVLAVSQKTETYLSSVMFSLLLLEFPTLLYYLNVKWAKWFTLYAPFHIVGSLGEPTAIFVAFAYSLIAGIIIYKVYDYLIIEYGVTL